MVKYFNAVLPFPSLGFSEVKRVGSGQRIWRFGTSGNLLKDWINTVASPDRLILSVDKNVKLYAVGLFGSENNKYSASLKVTDVNNVILANETGTFLSNPVQKEGGDYHGFDIVFKPPITLEAHSKYCFEAQIDGPSSCYGVNGMSEVKHSGVTFFFTEKGGYTKVSEGQFSEFVFRVIYVTFHIIC